MEWIQVLTIISAIVFYTYAFYMANRIKCIRKDINRMEEKFIQMENIHREDMKFMDEKCERLFKNLLLNQQGKGGLKEHGK